MTGVQTCALPIYVVVAVHDLPAGTKTESGVVTRNPIPQAHKIALVDIPAGGEIIRYGVVLGYAKNDIPAGSWINEHMLDLPESPALTDMPWGTDIKTPDQLPTCLLYTSLAEWRPSSQRRVSAGSTGGSRWNRRSG